MQLLHYTSLAFVLLSCFESTVAIPIGNDVIGASSRRLVSSWKATSVFRLWDSEKETHETIPEHHNPHSQQHLEIITSISPTSCHHKGPLRCAPSTPNPTAAATTHKYIYRYKPNTAPSQLLDLPASLTRTRYSKNENSRYGQPPSSHGFSHAGHDFERILAPVGLLVIMVWLGFVAVVLVALMDYMWVRWVRASNLYLAASEDRDVEATAGADAGAVIGLGIIDEDTRGFQEKMDIFEDEVCEDRIL